MSRVEQVFTKARELGVTPKEFEELHYALNYAARQSRVARKEVFGRSVRHTDATRAVMLMCACLNFTADEYYELHTVCFFRGYKGE